MRCGRRVMTGLSIVAAFGIFLPSAVGAGENTWTTSGPAVDVSSLAADPMDPRVLYAAATDGVYKTTNGGGSWSKLGGDGGIDGLTCIAVDPTRPGTLYAANYRPGDLFQSHDFGDHWARLDVNGHFRALAADASGVYVSRTSVRKPEGWLYGPGVSKSTDHGATWKPAMEARNVYALLGASFNRTVLAGTDYRYEAVDGDYPGMPDPFGGGVARSFDGGLHWQRPGTDLGGPVLALARSPLSHELVLAGTVHGLLFRSSDDGVTWNLLSAPGGQIQAITFDPSSENTVYLASGGLGVARSGDGGLTWTPMNEGLPTRAPWALVIDPTGTTLHVATEAGVFDRTIDSSPPVGLCDPGADHLCLLSSRFRVELTALDPNTRTPTPVQAVRQGSNFGFFSFPALTGDPRLPELFVKIVDATSLPGGGFWFFHGSLTSVSYSLTVTDMQTGAVREYYGQDLCGTVDTSAFPRGPAEGALNELAVDATSGGINEPLELLSGRFRLSLTSIDPRTGLIAVGFSIPQTDRFGYFSLPTLTGDPYFPEVFVKMIDATSLPAGKFWLFYSGLTTLPYTLTVEDTVTGTIRTYRSEAPDSTQLCGAVVDLGL